jgi:transcriptional regulator with XRE-family HTH domain
MNQLGLKIRTIRTQKGIGLNALAKKLDISSGYLSNLETGKTENVPLSLIPKLQTELNISFPDLFQTTLNEEKTFNEFHYRIERTNEQLKKLQDNNPSVANYLLSIVEQGLELYYEGGRNYH